MDEAKVKSWDGDGDPELSGWYVVIEDQGAYDLISGPLDTEAEAISIMHQYNEEAGRE